MDTVRRFAALATTLVLLAGLPWLATTLTWPVIDLSPLTWEVHLRSARLPPGVGTAVLILVLWTVWALYLLVVAAELLTRLGHRSSLQLGPLRPLQLLAATTLGGLALSPPAANAVAPAAAVAAELPKEEVDEQEDETSEQAVAEPFVVERSRVVDAFGYDSATLTEAMEQDLADTAVLIDEHGAPELPVVVTGHTDAAGDPDYNLHLSERRASAVADVLRTHLGEDAVIEVHGEGARHLLDTDDDAEQRRVEITYNVVVTPPRPEPPPAAEPPTGDESTAEEVAPGVGLALPGGLVLALAAGTAGMVGGMVVERHRHRPPAPAGELEEPGEPEADDHHQSAPAGREPVEEAAVPGEDATPPDGGDGPELAMIDLAGVPGVGITGPGAIGAARSLLARALDHAEDALTVVVPEADLRSLLGGTGRLPQLGEDTPVMVTEDVEDALTLLHLQVLARHRAADEHDTAEEQESALAEGPQFVLVADTDPTVASEVTSLLTHTGGAPLSAVLLGPWPHPDGPTLTLNSAGTITAADPPLDHVVGHRWPTTTSTALHQALATHHAPAHETPPYTADTTDPDPAPEPVQEDPVSGPPPADATPAGAVSVTVLGRITLAVRGRQVRPHRRTASEVLAYLAAHPAGVRMEAAVDAMWPAEAPHRAIRRWHDACTAVRTALRPDLGEAATSVIVHDGGDLYRLNPDLVVCDLWRVEGLLAEATTADTADAAVLVTSAAAMADGDFAEDTDYLWAEGVRTRIRSEMVRSLTTHSKEVDPRQAISMLNRALRIDSNASEAALELERRYAEKGDQKSAERVRNAISSGSESAADRLG
ncbi:OmpA family protein [Nocardiopsis sp. NPDC006139]|uniref:OmpA family protein n=1 Tax=Nocardiopsis sp. NPDC006139 TaxID=3154578 RepID=UPI0033B549B1